MKSVAIVRISRLLDGAAGAASAAFLLLLLLCRVVSALCCSYRRFMLWSLLNSWPLSTTSSSGSRTIIWPSARCPISIYPKSQMNIESIIRWSYKSVTQAQPLDHVT